MQVFKFGGASVKDAGSVRNVASILRDFAQQETIVVVSAMGKVTNLLEKLAKAYFTGSPEVPELIEAVRKFHLDIARELFEGESHAVFNELNNIFVELTWATEEPVAYSFDQHYDQIVSQGELLSSRIVAAYIKQEGIPCEWMDARGLIRTDETYREGRVDYEVSGALVQTILLPQLKRTRIVLTQGFIAGTAENFTTTLGREGSDYSAALLAYFADAEKVVIWKDVPGVLNADPRFFRNAKKIDELSYLDAIELTYYGASVIHPKTIKPLQNKKIPLYVKSFLAPKDPGTVIRESETRINVPGYIYRENQVLLSIQPRDFSFIGEENLSAIFAAFSQQRVHVNVMQNSAISFSVCVDDDAERIKAVMSDLGAHFRVLYNTGVRLLTIRNYNPEIIGRLTERMTILLEQRSRFTYQAVFAPTEDAS